MTGSDDADLLARIEPVVHDALACSVDRTQVLPAALGSRRFVRVWLRDPPANAGVTLIARIDAPEDDSRRPEGVAPEPPLEPLRALLERAGLPVPRRYAGAAGVELLEDLGAQSLDDVAARVSRDELVDLYREACALVPRLQAVAPEPGVAAFSRRLDAALFAHKAERFVRWSLGPAGLDTHAARETVRHAFSHVADQAARAPARLAHRDLQSANLLVAGAGAERRLVMIDLQGAFLAPPEYDLVCLLRDSYVELPDAIVEALLEEVRPELPDAPEPAPFRERFDLLTLTRKAKDHALFGYAADALGDDRYLRFQPTTLRYLRAAASRVADSHPSLGALAELLDALAQPR